MDKNETIRNFGALLGESFRAERKKRKQTLSQVASSCDSCVPYISKIETGNAGAVGLNLLKGIADAIPVNLYEVVAAAEGVDLGGLDALNTEERAIIAAFRAADAGGRSTLMTVADSLTIR